MHADDDARALGESLFAPRLRRLFADGKSIVVDRSDSEMASLFTAAEFDEKIQHCSVQRHPAKHEWDIALPPGSDERYIVVPHDVNDKPQPNGAFFWHVSPAAEDKSTAEVLEKRLAKAEVRDPLHRRLEDPLSPVARHFFGNIDRYQDPRDLPKPVARDDGFAYGNVLVPEELHEDYEKTRAYMAVSSEGRAFLAAFEGERQPSTTLRHTDRENPRLISLPEPVGLMLLGESHVQSGVQNNMPWISIGWDPRFGILTSSGGVRSPANVLAHEIVHAVEIGIQEDGVQDRWEQDTPLKRWDALGENSASHVENTLAKEHDEKTAEGYLGLRDSHQGIAVRTNGVTSTKLFYPRDAKTIEAKAPLLGKLTALLDREKYDPLNAKANSYGAVIFSIRERNWREIKDELMSNWKTRKKKQPHQSDKAVSSNRSHDTLRERLFRVNVGKGTLKGDKKPKPAQQPRGDFFPRLVSEHKVRGNLLKEYDSGREGNLSKIPDADAYLHSVGRASIILASEDVPPAVRDDVQREGERGKWVRLRSYDGHLESVRPKNPPDLPKKRRSSPPFFTR